MASTWGRVAQALADAQGKARTMDQQNAALADQQQQKELQRRALELGLQQQTAALTDRESAKAQQAARLAQRVAGLRRLALPGFEDATDDELAGVPDEVYQKALLTKLTPKKREPVPVIRGGKRSFAWKDETGALTDQEGNPITDAEPDQRPDTTPNQPVMGSPEWQKAQEFLANLRAKNGAGGGDDKVLVQVQQPDGSVVYVPRNQAVGKQAPRPQGSGGADRQKKIQALANAHDALSSFEKTLTTTGATLLPGTDKSALETDYENLQLQMKEMYNLGVLNGPDLALMRRIVNDPTSFKGRVSAFGSGDEQTARIQAQIGKLREKLNGYQKNLMAGNEALAPQAGAAPSKKSGVASKYGVTPSRP